MFTACQLERLTSRGCQSCGAVRIWQEDDYRRTEYACGAAWVIHGATMESEHLCATGAEWVIEETYRNA